MMQKLDDYSNRSDVSKKLESSVGSFKVQVLCTVLLLDAFLT